MAGNQLVLKLEPQEEICEESIAELDALLDPQEKDVLSCSQCDLAFTSDQRLQQHTRRAHERRNFPCSFCAYVANTKGNIKTHERHMHKEGIYHVLCPHCDKIFPQLNHLKNHLRTHTGEKPFVCNVCAKGFCHKSNLKKHQFIHSGERRFACKECGQRFKRQYHLKTHQRIHTGEKPYKCKLCEMKFSDSRTLTKHEQRMHTDTREKPFEMANNRLILKVEPQEIAELDEQLAPEEQDVFSCSQCPLAFTSHQLLHEHTISAHERRKFPCSFCAYRGKSSSDLKKHERRVHKGEARNHVCPHCNKPFTSAANL